MQIFIEFVHIHVHVQHVQHVHTCTCTHDYVYALPSAAAAKPPTGIGAVLERTRLTVSWKKPEGGATLTSYMIVYKAIGPEDPELGVKVVFGCPTEADEQDDQDENNDQDEEGTCSIILSVESEIADYNISMATLNDGVDLSTAWAVVLRGGPCACAVCMCGIARWAVCLPRLYVHVCTLRGGPCACMCVHVYSCMTWVG